MQQLESLPSGNPWNHVMYTGRICRCGHTQVCHWNGENKQGTERFDVACMMCSNTCSDFRDSGRRRTGAVYPSFPREDAVVAEGELVA